MVDRDLIPELRRRDRRIRRSRSPSVIVESLLRPLVSYPILSSLNHESLGEFAATHKLHHACLIFRHPSCQQFPSVFYGLWEPSECSCSALKFCRNLCLKKDRTLKPQCNHILLCLHKWDFLFLKLALSKYIVFHELSIYCLTFSLTFGCCCYQVAG